jgi:hypothetical protein
MHDARVASCGGVGGSRDGAALMQKRGQRAASKPVIAGSSARLSAPLWLDLVLSINCDRGQYLNCRQSPRNVTYVVLRPIDDP